jgi:hypothetical protein
MSISGRRHQVPPVFGLDSGSSLTLGGSATKKYDAKRREINEQISRLEEQNDALDAAEDEELGLTQLRKALKEALEARLSHPFVTVTGITPDGIPPARSTSCRSEAGGGSCP